MPLVLGVRADVERKALPKTSVLSSVDQALLKLHNCWLDVHFAAEEIASCQAKLDRLDALLDDPNLAETYPPDHPDRIAAIGRHFELMKERDRARQEFRRAAKSTAKAWEDVPSEEEQYEYHDTLVRAWDDSPAFALALMDAGLNRLQFWAELLATWRNRSTAEVASCPF